MWNWLDFREYPSYLKSMSRSETLINPKGTKNYFFKIMKNIISLITLHTKSWLRINHIVCWCYLFTFLFNLQHLTKCKSKRFDFLPYFHAAYTGIKNNIKSPSLLTIIDPLIGLRDCVIGLFSAWMREMTSMRDAWKE